MKLNAADLFCGAGGTSTGALRAAEARGARLTLTAVNHWDVAIETHARNHPRARHLCSNVYQLAPRDAVPEGRLDLLMASPTCTFHSRARGGRPISRQQRWGRMTPTQVVRWADELKARILLVENVPEFVRWGPVHLSEPTQARCKRKRCVAEKPCKARAGSYFRAWIRKLKRLGFVLEWRVLNAADYGDATTRRRFFLIGRRDGIPLRWPEPTHAKDPAERGLFDGARTRWRGAREVIDWGLLGASIFTRTKPLSPNTLRRIHVGAIRFGWPAQIVSMIERHRAGLPVDRAPVQGEGVVGEPFVLSQASGGAPRSTDSPVPTIACDGAHALVASYYGNGTCRRVSSPLPTVTTKDTFGLAVPAFFVSAFGERKGQRPRVRSIERPTPTICAKGRVNLVTSRGGDVLYRMLAPHELSASMGFPEGYDFAGSDTDVKQQIGNAVPVNTAAALVGALMEAK